MNISYVNFSGTSGEDLIQEFGCQKTIEKCQDFHLNIQDTMSDRYLLALSIMIGVSLIRIFIYDIFQYNAWYGKHGHVINHILDILLFAGWLYIFAYNFFL